MTWSLIEALTGVRTSDDYDSQQRGYDRVVTVKTHYPVKNARHGFESVNEQVANGAIVILRNPLYAIPSYFNLRYEHQHELPNHSTRGPKKAWLEYREHPGHGFSVQLPAYEQFVVYWLERFASDRSNLLLLSYEDLTDETNGPLVAMQIVEFLNQKVGVGSIEREAIPCIWRTIVKEHGTPSKPQAVQTSNPTRRKLSLFGHSRISERSGPRVRPYTMQQLYEFKACFQRLLARYEAVDPEFARIMSSYVDTAEKYHAIQNEEEKDVLYATYQSYIDSLEDETEDEQERRS